MEEPPTNKIKTNFIKFEEWGNRFLTLRGFLAATAGTAINGFFGITEGFSPFVFLTTGILTFTLIFIAVGIGLTKKMQTAAIGGIVLIMAAGVLYSLYYQKQAEAATAKEAAIERQNYSLDANGVATTLQLGENRDYVIGAVVDFEIVNDNDFPIWIRVDRLVTSIENKISDTRLPVLVKKIMPNSSFGLADNFIKFDKPLIRNSIAVGNIDAHICYGRNPRKLDKDLIYKGPLVIRYNADGSPVTFFEIGDDDEQLVVCRK